MAQRWSFEEEYIVCKFSYGHMLREISKLELFHLSLNLKENSGHVRSESVLRKKIRIYQDAFAGNDSPYATKQMRGVSNAYLERLLNPEYYEKLASRINQLYFINDSDELYVEDSIQFETSDLYHLRPLVPRAPSFKEVLIDFIEKSGMTDVQVYKASRVSRDKFNHIFNGRKGKKKNVANNNDSVGVSRRTIMQLCLGLRLSYEDALILMESAGCHFKLSEDTDRVVLTFLQDGLYDMDEVNMELYDRGLQIFSESRYDAM